MWTVVYIASTQKLAKQIQQYLTREGVLVTVRPTCISSTGQQQFEILVPESEAEEAHEVLSSFFCT